MGPLHGVTMLVFLLACSSGKVSITIPGAMDDTGIHSNPVDSTELPEDTAPIKDTALPQDTAPAIDTGRSDTSAPDTGTPHQDSALDSGAPITPRLETDPVEALSFYWLITEDGYESSLSIILANTGGAALNVSSVYVNNDVTALCGSFHVRFEGPFELPADGSTSISITYTVTESCLDLPSMSFDTNILHILSDDPDSPDYQIMLSATVL